MAFNNYPRDIHDPKKQTEITKAIEQGNSYNFSVNI